MDLSLYATEFQQTVFQSPIVYMPIVLSLAITCFGLTFGIIAKFKYKITSQQLIKIGNMIDITLFIFLVYMGVLSGILFAFFGVLFKLGTLYYLAGFVFFAVAFIYMKKIKPLLPAVLTVRFTILDLMDKLYFVICVAFIVGMPILNGLSSGWVTMALK